MKDPIRVTTATKIWRCFRRFFARSEWAVWLLGLKRNDCNETDRGLVLIQIDGLSRKQLTMAISNGRMPFLKSLCEKEHYSNHLLYSGLPASTPAVQAELYYGEKTVVPGFGFRDHRTGRLTRMLASDVAAEVEAKLSEKNVGLLAGGSSYSNIYGGGADEVHFCATSFGWSEFLKTINPLQVALLAILNIWLLMRIIGLMTIEFFLALGGFFRGVFSGKRFWQELIMIPARVVIVVLLRELVTIGASFDTARGLPIIYLNLLGYDEQAHRRGPDSKFAHWTLQGIDSCIRRIWNAAHQGAGREYDLWVVSDHGQEKTKPYEIAQGKLIQQAVAEVVEAIVKPVDTDPIFHETETQPGVGIDTSRAMNRKDRRPTRADWIGLGWLVSMLFGEQDKDMQSRSPLVQTVTTSSIGFVYLQTENGRQKVPEIAEHLVQQCHVPMCGFLEKGIPTISTPAGSFVLPEQRTDVFGNEHPFIDEIANDLIQLLRHSDSGDIVLIGWDGENETTSFVLQNGAHAGPGIDETSAFALLPSDTLLPVKDRDYLRPNDLRLAALRFLGRDEHGMDLSRRRSKRSRPRRILTYNVHACVGMDGQLSPERIARVIDQSEADIICLQELDVLRRRSGNRDQAHAIAQYLEMSHQFHPAWHLEEEQFGNAILTRLPMRIVQKESLHHHKADRSRRSALWVEVELENGIALQIINTHLSIYPKEQKIQAQQLIDEWIQPAQLLGPVILCGDFNALPGSKTHQMLSNALHDIETFDTNPTRRTLFSPLPISRVDHGFISDELLCQRVLVDNSRLAKIASDHLPLLFELSVLQGEVESTFQADSLNESK